MYKLDRLLQEESGTLHILQQDKELLEKALGGLRHKLQVNRSNPVEVDRYRKQQKLIEKELSRVRLLLAHNSKVIKRTFYIFFRNGNVRPFGTSDIFFFFLF